MKGHCEGCTFKHTNEEDCIYEYLQVEMFEKSYLKLFTEKGPLSYLWKYATFNTVIAITLR